MNDISMIGTATSSVLGSIWTGEAASARCTVPPVRPVKGTSLPIAGGGARFGGVEVLMGADQLQGTGVDRVRAAADQGIPPRWRPVRC
jgi:hypothetical protein